MRANPSADVVQALRTLVAFDTTSRNSNLELIDWVCECASEAGARVRLTRNADETKANALLSFGPDVEGGIVLSGHTDVVPVDGQQWSRDPFQLFEDSGRLYGRGAADMKGFIAACVACMPLWQRRSLEVPIHVALSFDEEIGCLGVPLLVQDFVENLPPPAFVLVGEPTGMRLATTHKGFCLFQTSFTGKEAHSSLAHQGVSAIAAAARFVNYLLDTGALLTYRHSKIPGLLPGYTTFNVGKMEGGSAINIIPRRCSLTWEFRPVPDEDVAAIKGRVEAFLDAGLMSEFGINRANGRVQHELLLEVPPLHADKDSVAARQIAEFLGAEEPIVVPFGTEAGFYASAGWPAVVCGPGHIEQAHQPDEWTEAAQLHHCMRLLDQIADLASRSATHSKRELRHVTR